MIRNVLFCIIGLVGGIAIGLWARFSYEPPRSYEDCILDRMREGLSDITARAIVDACRKIQERSAESNLRTLSEAEVANIRGRASPDLTHVFYQGSLYNGNLTVTVASVLIGLNMVVGSDTTSNIYRHEVTIPPMTTETFSIRMLGGQQGADYSWQLLGAKGYEAEWARKR